MATRKLSQGKSAGKGKGGSRKRRPAAGSVKSTEELARRSQRELVAENEQLLREAVIGEPEEPEEPAPKKRREGTAGGSGGKKRARPRATRRPPHLH